MITLRNVSKGFKDGHRRKTVLDNVSIKFKQGESIAITGESGSGKSTLLHLIGALDQPDSGDINVNGQNLPTLTEIQQDNYRKLAVGFIFQRFNLIDCLTVWDNIMLTQRITKQLDIQYAESLMRTLGIYDLKDAHPVNLSGGEQQRIAIARALAHRPSLILADEPTGNLDDTNSQTISSLLFSCCESANTTLLIVTHSGAIAANADSIFRLNNGQLSATT